MYENQAMTAPGFTGIDKIDYRPPSLTEQMTHRKARLECELAEVNRVLEGLTKNPEAAALFDSISRLGGLRG